MSLSALESTVNAAFDARETVSTATRGEVRDAVDHALELLDKGEVRVGERQAEPVIVEDDCFIGARSEVAEGVIVRKGAVLAMGVFLGASTKIVDRDTGETFIGEVPEYAVVVPGALPGRPLKNGQPGPSTACAVIVKRVDERTRAKTSINELLRD